MLVKGKRAVIYARSATVQELGPNFAMAEQIHQCKAYGLIQGYEIVEEFQEVGSGNSLDRPILKSLLDAAKEGRFDAVIIHTFDRLSRLPEQASVIIETLEGYGVKVQSARENAQLERMILAIFEEVERIKKERISLRIRAGRKANK
jgi:DNA invertase Pin-like site-specific DNA recombinase